jgi:hypothetical protein
MSSERVRHDSAFGSSIAALRIDWQVRFRDVRISYWCALFTDQFLNDGDIEHIAEFFGRWATQNGIVSITFCIHALIQILIRCLIICFIAIYPLFTVGRGIAIGRAIRQPENIFRGKWRNEACLFYDGDLSLTTDHILI